MDNMSDEQAIYEAFPGMDTDPAFTPTSFHVEVDEARHGYRRIDVVAPWAAQWDGIPDARLALFSDVTKTRAYAKIEVTGRAVRWNHRLESYTLRVRVTFLESGTKAGGTLIYTGGKSFDLDEVQKILESAQVHETNNR